MVERGRTSRDRRYAASLSKRGTRILIAGLLVLLQCSGSTASMSGPSKSATSSHAAGAPDTHSPFAEAIANLRRLFEDTHRIAETEIEGKRLLAEVEAGIGRDSPEALEISSMLVTTLLRQSSKRVPEAVALAERALESAERIYPNGDLRLVKPLDDLGGALDYLGSFEESKFYRERALSIREAALGPDDPSVADSLGNLAWSLQQLGDYASAALLFERILAILEKREHHDYSALPSALASLAATYRGVGDLQTALAFAERSVQTLERAPVSEQGQLGRMLGTKANVLHDMWRYAEARDVWERAIRLWTEQLGPDDVNVAWGLSAQALDLSGLGEHKRAREQAERALRIQSEQVDLDRTLVLFLRNLADVLINAGDDIRAKPLLERAVRLRELAYGPMHVGVAPLLDALSRVEYRLARDAEAFEHALRSESIVREDFLRTARVLSERQVYQFEKSRASGLQIALSALSRGRLGSDSAGRAWEELVRSRALVLDELTSRHRAATLGEGPEVAALNRELRAVRSRLAFLAMGSAGGTPLDGMAQVQARKESIERQLSRISSEYRRQVERRSVGLGAIRSALPEGAALLAYVEFAMVPPLPQKGPHGVTTAAAESHLGAFVLSASSPEPTFIRLGPTREIEPLILQCRKRAAEAPASLEPPLGPSEERYRNDGRLLREKVWDPLLPVLRGVRTLFIVPDGALQLVSFATLPVGEDRYLVESGPLLHYLSAERDLVHRARREYPKAGALIVGGPDVDAQPAALLTSGPSAVGSIIPSADRPMVAKRSFRSSPPGCEDFRSRRFEPLSAAGWEASQVGALIRQRSSVLELKGADATEEAFKAMAPGRSLLHVATHGFFLDGKCPSALEQARTRGGASGWPQQAPGQILGDNPLLLSGLVLAGANRRSEIRPADADDGILTAEEIGSLDLSATQWAVLSACETGVGRVEAGEGVLGLRRAFAVAGVGSLIMSLWRVDDEATREWMSHLYRGRLSGLSTAGAVREASLSMIRKARARGESTHPFSWGGFVAEGDWR